MGPISSSSWGVSRRGVNEGNLQFEPPPRPLPPFIQPHFEQQLHGPFRHAVQLSKEAAELQLMGRWGVGSRRSDALLLSHSGRDVRPLTRVSLPLASRQSHIFSGFQCNLRNDNVCISEIGVSGEMIAESDQRLKKEGEKQYLENST